MVEIKKRLKNEKIKIIKHNYSLSSSTQNFPACEGFMHLSDDMTKLIIFTKKPKVQIKQCE